MIASFALDETSGEEIVDFFGLSLTLLPAAALGGLATYVLLRFYERGRGRNDETWRRVHQRGRLPVSLFVAFSVALVTLQEQQQLGELARDRIGDALTIGAIASLAVAMLRAADGLQVALLDRYNIAATDNAKARGRHTRITIARRLFTAIVLALAAGAILTLFDDARTVGRSLLATAGIAGAIAAVAAQSTLSNLIAGVQLAIAEPVSLDDVVVVEGEWGNIESITLTHVVVRIWDRRRLVLPTSYFTSTPFENWTRNGSQIIGTVLFELDHRTPMSQLRQEFHRQVEANPNWDGDIAVLQVTDTTPTTMTVRAIASAGDAQQVWDLRCAIREGLIAWLAGHHPESLPTMRLLEAAAGRAPKTETDPTVLFTTSPGPDTEPNPVVRTAITGDERS